MIRKGQMFIVLSVIVIIIIVTIKTSIDVVDILDKKRQLESSLERLEFRNVRDESIKAAVISANYTTNISRATNDFISFAKIVFESKSMTLRGITVLSIYPTVTANADTRINVTVFNFLDVPISTLILNFTYNTAANQTFNFTVSGSRIETNFTFNTGITRNYTLWIYYNTSLESVTENITVNVEVGRSKFIGFYDLKVKGVTLEQRDKFTETLIIP